MNQDMNFLPILFATLHKRMMDYHQQVLTKYGLAKIHMPYLMILHEHPEGMTQREMIDSLFLDKAHASRALKDLVQLGFVRKDDEGTYKNKYYILDLGKALIQESRSEGLRLREKLASVLSKDEIEQFRHISSKIMSIFE